MPKEASTKSKKSKASAEKETKSKAKKDPNAPKRGLSAYMFFSQDWRDRVKAENPEAGFGEIGKLLGAKWKELDEDEKKPYIDQAAKDKNAPKRALSAYMFFSQDWRERIKAENPDAGFGEVGKLLGAKWKELDEDEKKPYVELAAKDKTRAEQEKSAYDGKNGAASGEGEADEASD